MGDSMRPERPEPIAHGGDLDLARRRFPNAPEPWIDLSTGINPVSYPVPVLSSDVWTRLPQSGDLDTLRRVAQRRYSTARAEQIVCAPGTQSVIQSLPRLVASSRVCVIGPTYGEHAVSWRRAGHDVREVSDLEAALDARVVVVVNPDNPTGRIVPPDTLCDVARHLARDGGLLVVDEAFADAVAGDVSVVPALPPSTVVLRSFGKMYGLAGLRLGFAIADGDLAEGLRDALGPWAVSGPALALGIAALSDDAWLKEAQVRLRRDAARLDGMLADCGCAVIGGTGLFRLAAHPQAERVAHALGCAGLLVRTFAHAPQWLRFGMPGDEDAWGRLAQALETVRGFDDAAVAAGG